MTPRLVGLELAAFRGIAKPVVFSLDADAVVIRGDNGLGKTSIVDALWWLLCGDLAHISRKIKGLRKSADPIVNRYSEGPARVKLAVRDSDRIWSFERTGNAGSNTLEASVDGVAVGDAAHELAALFGHADDTRFKGAVQAWGILRQDAVQAALDAGAALHERLASVVGLERVTQFVESSARLVKDLSRERRILTGQVDAAKRADADARDSVRQLRAAAAQASRQTGMAALLQLRSGLPEGIELDVSALLDRDALATVGRRAGALIEAIQRLTSARATLRQQVESQQIGMVEASRGLTLAQERLEEITERAPLIVQLAGSALQLLGPTCPVCEQTIDSDSVQRHLEELLNHAQTDRQAERRARDSVRSAQQQMAAAEQAAARVQAAQAELSDATEALSALLAEDGGLRVASWWSDREHEEELLSAIVRLRDRLRLVYSQLPDVYQPRLAAAESTAKVAADELARLTLELQNLESRHQRAAVLEKAAHTAAERIVNSALERIGPSFAEVFDRLAPHSTFTVLRAAQDIYFGKNQVVPEVFDPERRVAANPLAVFSEGQLNVVALSYFLGLALNARDGALPFMVLDDPLQAMDVLSVLGFADLSRRIRDQRQLIITTHDRRFGDVLVRKLAPRDLETQTLVIEFSGWTRDGPEFTESYLRPAVIGPVLQEA